MEYIERLFDDILEFALKSKGAVVIVGPKGCGKSTTAVRYCNSLINLRALSIRDDFIEFAKAAPSQLLNLGEKPLLITEWQHIAFIWDQIKYEVDRTGRFGQYILTGSVTDKEKSESIDESTSRHTGNGRIIKKLMRTMSLYESGDSNGSVSLSDLKEGIFDPTFSDKTIEDYAFYVCRGGWPIAIKQEQDVALQQARDYVEMVVCEEIFSLKDIPIRKDEQRARKVMRAYARNVSIAASDKTIREDCTEAYDSFDKDSFNKYINALENLYVIEELPAWNPNLRSKTAIRSKSTRHFIDPSIGVAALGLTPKSLFKNIKEFGLLFESLVIRDLRIYCDMLGAKVYKYRDSKKREADAVIHFPDGSWALVEVKLGNKEDIKIACENLRAIADDIDYEKTGKPAFLMVVTKNKVAYKSEDGVYIVPLACLKN